MLFSPIDRDCSIPWRKVLFWTAESITTLPLRRTLLRLTKYQASSRNSCSPLRAMDLWSIVRPLWHCNPGPCGKIKPVPNRSTWGFFCDGWRWCSEVWHLGAWCLCCGRNPEPALNGVYFEKFKQIEPDLHIVHVGDQWSEVHIVQVIKYLS